MQQVGFDGGAVLEGDRGAPVDLRMAFELIQSGQCVRADDVHFSLDLVLAVSDEAGEGAQVVEGQWLLRRSAASPSRRSIPLDIVEAREYFLGEPYVPGEDTGKGEIVLT